MEKCDLCHCLEAPTCVYPKRRFCPMCREDELMPCRFWSESKLLQSQEEVIFCSPRPPSVRLSQSTASCVEDVPPSPKRSLEICEVCSGESGIQRRCLLPQLHSSTSENCKEESL